MDGVPGVSQFPVPPGGNFTYRFSVKDEYGFYWYHSHFRAYYSDATRGPLMIHPSPSRRRPFEELASSNDELSALLQAERDAAPVLLTDWYHRLSDEVFAQYFETGAFPNCVDSLLANGYGRVQCLPDYILQAGAGLGIETLVAADPHDPAPTPMDSMDAMPTGSMSMDPTSMDSMSMDSMSMDSMTMDSMTTDSMTTDSMTMEMHSMRQRAATEDSAMPGMETSGGMISSLSVTASATVSQPPTEPSVMSTMMPMSSMSSMSDMGSSPLGPHGCTPPMMFKPGYNLTSLPPETCTNTTSSLLTIPANYSQGWLALNLVNAASVSRMSVSVDAHSMFVYAADGLFVALQEVKVLHISIGQRYSVMIKLNQQPGDYFLRFASYPLGDMQQVIEGQAIVSYNVEATNDTNLSNVRFDEASTWMLTNGSAKLNASELDVTLLAAFDGNIPPSTPADTTLSFMINQTDIVTWVVDGSPYLEPERPILYGNASDGWNANTTYHLPSNSTVDIIMNIANDSLDMGHPMHLHGHKFWHLGSGNGTFPYDSLLDAPQSLINLRNPPYRDTIDLPPSGWAVIRYVTDNPGAWLFHCHIQWHLVGTWQSGMALVLMEGDEQLPGIIGARVNTTMTQPPSAGSTTAGAASAYTLHSYLAHLVAAALGVVLSFY
ncbi:hypothetical protein W97_05084 [Coniosporium apollinis CBS 100218]|uniref:Multicopper oxidase n=1 Tax=Coniosporium apollinis (strain CBS 100218) TaxID=1168221 RepID=R7YVA7_CONA1|nr:uncharacterized protein W97_05084 [Coniosporium apollinis CBS 100218]EON65842.1 hypothetical protein W97_05084 [Coniosporium apollinis CBS 100218]